MYKPNPKNDPIQAGDDKSNTNDQAQKGGQAFGTDSFETDDYNVTDLNEDTGMNQEEDVDKKE